MLAAQGAITDQEAAMRNLAITAVDMTDASDRYTAAQADAEAASEAVSKALSFQNLTLGYGTSAYTTHTRAVQDAERAANDLRYAADNLAAGLSGVLGKATDDYTTSVSNSEKEIESIQKELAELGAIQGQVTTTTTAAKYSNEELALAQIKAAEAAQKSAEYTGDDEAAKLALAVAAQKAAEKAEAMAGAMGGTSSSTIDNTERIGELNSRYGELVAQQAAAKEALNRVTLEFIYQKAAADLDTEAALELARSFGLIDEKSYSTAKAVNDLKTKYDANRDGAIDASEAAAGYTEEVRKLGEEMTRLETYKLVTIDVRTSYSTNGSPPNPAAGEVGIGPTGDASNAYSTGDGGGTITQEAHGGQVYANTPTIVGDGGRAELFVPQSSGYVFPAVPAGGGGMGRSEMEAMIAAMITAVGMIPRLVRDGMQRSY